MRNNTAIADILLSLYNCSRKYTCAISNNLYFVDKYIFKSLIKIFDLILEKTRLYILSATVLIYKKNSCLDIYIAFFQKNLISIISN